MIEELGSGGMATVYRARDRELRRDVAIKVLFPHLCKNREIVARFQREARAAAGLDHPHILRVFDVGGGGAESGGDPPFMVLELVRGPSLVQLAEAGPLLAELVAACGVALASALVHAHKAGVIHRDIKPGNLLVADGGRLVLADFGVARVAEDDSSLVTKTGALLGTPAFMSPEQATGAPLDARSDLYSVGATLYQLATGSVPVSGGAARAVAQIVAGEVVPPLRRNPSMGRDLARLIERLMAVDPAARVANAREMEEELHAIVEAAGAGSPEELCAELFADREACEARLVPIVVAKAVARARVAVAEGNAARALALCDRALALDAGCREAEEIAESIGARRMWRRVAAALAGVVLVAGSTVAAWTMWPRSEERARPMAAARPVVLIDASVPVAVEVADAAPEEKTQDAGDRTQDTGHRTPKKEQRVAVPEPEKLAADAAPARTEPPAVEKPAADATLTVEMDTWCDLAIDGGAAVRITKRKSVTLRPGRHKVACTNSGLNQTWTQEVDLAPGEKRTVRGAMVPEVLVTVRLADAEAAVRIDGTRVVASGGTAKLKRGSHRVEIMRAGERLDSRYVSVMGPCTLRDRPEISCIAQPGSK